MFRFQGYILYFLKVKAIQVYPMFSYAYVIILIMCDLKEAADFDSTIFSKGLRAAHGLKCTHYTYEMLWKYRLIAYKSESEYMRIHWRI